MHQELITTLLVILCLALLVLAIIALITSLIALLQLKKNRKDIEKLQKGVADICHYLKEQARLVSEAKQARRAAREAAASSAATAETTPQTADDTHTAAETAQKKPAFTKLIHNEATAATPETETARSQSPSIPVQTMAEAARSIDAAE